MTPVQLDKYRENTKKSYPYGWTFCCKRCRGIFGMEKRKMVRSAATGKPLYLCTTCKEIRDAKRAAKAAQDPVVSAE